MVTSYPQFGAVLRKDYERGVRGLVPLLATLYAGRLRSFTHRCTQPPVYFVHPLDNAACGSTAMTAPSGTAATHATRLWLSASSGTKSPLFMAKSTTGSRLFQVTPVLLH